MDAAQIAQMGGASGDEQLMVGLGSRAAAATGQTILLRVQRARRSATGLFVLCSHFLEISTHRQEIFLIFMIAYVLKSRIIVS